MTEPKQPWWWPCVIDAAWIQDLRETYEDTDSMSDEEVIEHYGGGSVEGGYAVTWDHTGDAMQDYEKLADAFLKLVAETGRKPEDFA